MSFMDREQLSGAALREERRARLVRGTLRLPSGTVIAALVRNLSDRGLGMTTKSRPPARGDAVVVTLPGSPDLDGVVRWVREHDFGVELGGSVDTDQLATAIRTEIARMKDAGEWQVSSLHRVHTPPAAKPRRPV
ncbi:PilZ domain-containing protein [Novosphingobium sp. FSW06-99]|uniref:PilZ domain-containing protein n=1 Tax=Novosphingobium sp. FSW06-99 TaxID=1739113 RepID=UPI00076C9475|nr:PilZ domain-containing protein [Novosphingobium sp. FSW06-99]KUR80629.1 hypothetical protein AQZ49_00850 [Novosphingobium sp. FSW06-99]